MSVSLTKSFQLKVLQYLFEYFDDGLFHQIPDAVLNIVIQKDKFEQLKQLEDLGLVLFQDAVKYSPPPVIFFDFNNPCQSSQIDAPENTAPIWAKITNTGYAAVNTYNESNN